MESLTQDSLLCQFMRPAWVMVTQCCLWKWLLTDTPRPAYFLGAGDDVNAVRMPQAGCHAGRGSLSMCTVRVVLPGQTLTLHPLVPFSKSTGLLRSISSQNRLLPILLPVCLSKRRKNPASRLSVTWNSVLSMCASLRNQHLKSFYP